MDFDRGASVNLVDGLYASFDLVDGLYGTEHSNGTFLLRR